MKIIGITCSRSLADKVDFLTSFVTKPLYKIRESSSKRDIVFLTGDADSDYACGKVLEDLGYKVLYFRPAHNQLREGIMYTPLLYQARNMNIVDNCDYLLSLWDGESKGVQNTVAYAKASRVEVYQYIYGVDYIDAEY